MGKGKDSVDRDNRDKGGEDADGGEDHGDDMSVPRARQ